MYRFVLEGEIEGDDDEDTLYKTILAVKYVDEWYLFYYRFNIEILPIFYEFASI